MFILHKTMVFKIFLLLHVTKSILGVLTSFMHHAIIATYYFICNVRCNMASIASMISVAIICTILRLSVLVKVDCWNSAESCAMLCKTEAFS